MLKPLLIVPALLLIGAPAFFQQSSSTPPTQASSSSQSTAPAPSAIPPEYMTMTNPVTPTPESQARAQKQYGWDCAMCHGDNGNGKGDVAVEQKLTIRDFRDPASLKGISDGQLFYIIKNGQGQMPSESGRAKPDEIWNLVIYIRRMSGQPAAGAQPPA